jgi:hypothetical protein
VTYKGRENIKKMYLRIFNSMENITFHPIERFSTPDRVFDDMLVTFRITGDGFENCPFPIGTKVKIQLGGPDGSIVLDVTNEAAHQLLSQLRRQLRAIPVPQLLDAAVVATRMQPDR